MRLFVLAFVLGTLVLQHEAELPGFPWAGLGAVAALARALLPQQWRLARALLVVAAGALLGYGLAAWRGEARLGEALPFALEGRDVPLTGIVASLPQVSSEGARFVFEVEEGAQVPRTVSLAWRPGAGESLPAIVPGQRWMLVARLKRPRGLANPHAFDFEPWALERGIRATGYVRDKPAPRLATRIDGWPYTLNRWRAEVRDAIAAHLAGAPLRGVIAALAVGDQDAVAPEDWDVFWRTGVGHLISISGLHITMLAGLAYALVAFAWVRIPALALRWPARRIAIVAGLAVALAYSLLAGFAVPAQRTATMLGVVAACVLAGRHGSASRVLALAALAVLLLDPWAVLSGGFWLSFGAVAAIFHVMALRTGRRGKVRAALLEQAAVTLAMAPMLLALFQELSLVAPLANAMAIPLVSLVVVPLTLAGAFLPLPLLLDAAHLLMLALMVPLQWLADLPHAMLETHAPAAWAVAGAALGCLWLLAPRGFPMRSLGALWVAPLFAIPAPAPARGEAWIDVLDVGNGLAVTVRTATHALAYDAGPSWGADSDSGERIVVPFLRGEGVRRLDALVISHADDDHSGGAISLAYRREPRWLLASLPASDALHAMVPRSIACLAGHAWEWDGVRFTVLHPQALGEARKENDRSCVLRVATRGHAMLLAGDVEARGEREMLARQAALLPAQVLLVPHHGSRTSSTPAFIDAVAPRVAVYSVGYRNRFRHPNEAVWSRYAERGIVAYRTDRDGAVHVVLPAAPTMRPTVETHSRAARYWSERRGVP